MDCINCSAPLPPKTTRCPFCKTMNDIDLRGKVTVKRGITSRQCPRCEQQLTAVLLGLGAEQVEIDRCLKCHGLFFDPGEVEQILDRLEQRAEDIDHQQLLGLIEKETPTGDFETVTYVPCPDCRQLMHRRSFGQRAGVIIDSCREHGIWLDGGELRRLIRWTQAGGRRHHRVNADEKARIEANLQKTPASLPPGEAFDPDATSSRRRRIGGLGDILDVADTVIGILRVLT